MREVRKTFTTSSIKKTVAAAMMTMTASLIWMMTATARLARKRWVAEARRQQVLRQARHQIRERTPLAMTRPPSLILARQTQMCDLCDGAVVCLSPLASVVPFLYYYMFYPYRYCAGVPLDRSACQPRRKNAEAAVLIAATIALNVACGFRSFERGQRPLPPESVLLSTPLASVLSLLVRSSYRSV